MVQVKKCPHYVGISYHHLENKNRGEKQSLQTLQVIMGSELLFIANFRRAFLYFSRKDLSCHLDYHHQTYLGNQSHAPIQICSSINKTINKKNKFLATDFRFGGKQE